MLPAHPLRKSNIAIAALLSVAVSIAPAQRPVVDQAVLQYLDKTISWYRDIAAAGGAAGSSREAVFTDNLRESSLQALRSAFQFARADAAIPPAKAPAAAAQPDTRTRNLAQAEAAAEQRIEQVQGRIAVLDREIERAAARRREVLAARRGKLEGDLNLAKARRAALRGVIGVLNGSDPGLAGKIDDLEQTVPELQAAQKGPAAPPAPARAAAQDFRPENSGIVGLTTEVIGVSGRVNRLNHLMRATAELQNMNESLRAPLRAALLEVIRRGDAIAAMPESDNPEDANAARKELDGLLARFKLLSAVSGPLGQGRTALSASSSSLSEWRSALGEQYSSALRYLLFRLVMLAVAVLVIFFFSELWRRATLRYVQDVRRRRQFLVLRRIVVGCTVALFVALSFVTEFGSIATFAGFSAAGIALAMQSVILSVVAYFFLVGRWGVRAGDRVTVGGVTGDVVEIGLFRLYLAEVAGKGLDLNPTGRIVVFPNAVFFQPAAMFKQLPGLNYVWSTVSLALASDCDREVAEKRLLAAVETVYGEYRESIERQYRTAQASLDLHAAVPRPEGRMRLADGRLEFVVRYPVEIRRAADVEDRLTRELMRAIEDEPCLRLAPGAAPRFEAGAGDGGLQKAASK